MAKDIIDSSLWPDIINIDGVQYVPAIRAIELEAKLEATWIGLQTALARIEKLESQLDDLK
jgi:hypothetical protein